MTRLRLGTLVSDVCLKCCAVGRTRLSGMCVEGPLGRI